MQRTTIGTFLVASTLFGSGCFPWMFDDNDPDPIPPPPPADDTGGIEGPGVPPSVYVLIPDWPPLGPGDEINVSVETRVYGLAGTNYSLAIPTEDLGEGFGQLSLIGYDIQGGWAERLVNDLLIDFSPPEIYLGQTILPAAGASFEVWVADDWVLGRFELEVGDVLLVDELEPGYPASLGEAWHESLVKFPTSALPQGASLATFRAIDAAGNVAEEVFELTVDGQPPSCGINAPTANAVLSGPFVVDLVGVDPGGGPVWFEVYVSGSPVATDVGPFASVELDAGELTPGTHLLEAIAIDRAGNESLVAEVPFIVP